MFPLGLDEMLTWVRFGDDDDDEEQVDGLLCQVFMHYKVRHSSAAASLEQTLPLIHLPHLINHTEYKQVQSLEEKISSQTTT